MSEGHACEAEGLRPGGAGSRSRFWADTPKIRPCDWRATLNLCRVAFALSQSVPMLGAQRPPLEGSSCPGRSFPPSPGGIENAGTPSRTASHGTRRLAARSSIGCERRHPFDRESGAGVAAAHGTRSNVLVAGVAGLVAGAMSMAAGGVRVRALTVGHRTGRPRVRTRGTPRRRQGRTQGNWRPSTSVVASIRRSRNRSPTN